MPTVSGFSFQVSAFTLELANVGDCTLLLVLTLTTEQHWGLVNTTLANIRIFSPTLGLGSSRSRHGQGPGPASFLRKGADEKKSNQKAGSLAED